MTVVQVGQLDLALDDVGQDFGQKALGAVEGTHGISGLWV